MGHKGVLLNVLRDAGLEVPPLELPETAFALTLAAMTQKERGSAWGVPRLGISTDRRALCHLGETFKEDNIKCLLCFICGCKYIYHQGFDKFGQAVYKGDISYRLDTKHRLTQLMHGDEEGTYDKAWLHNMSRKRFLNCFGEAVRSDESFARDTWEWKRRVHRDSHWQEVMCNPEDVRPSARCAHDENTVCSSCRIPICNDCWRYSMRNESIPKALTNDNFLGYLHRYFVEHLVRAMGLPERGISYSCAMGAGSGQGKGGSAGDYVKRVPLQGRYNNK